MRHHQQGWGGHGAGTSWGGHGAGTSRGGLRLATHAGLGGGLLLIAGGGVGVGLDGRKQVEGLAAQGGVEPGDRFVEQEVARGQGQGPGDGDPLRLAAGDLVGPALPYLAANLEALQHPPGPTGGLLTVAHHPQGAQRGGHLRQH